MRSLRSLRDYKTMSNNLRILPTHQTTSNHMMSTVNSQSLSTALTVISANIEGLTAAKASMLSEMCKREHCHCFCLQETHREPHLPRPKIPGITLIAERPGSCGTSNTIQKALYLTESRLGRLFNRTR